MMREIVTSSLEAMTLPFTIRLVTRDKAKAQRLLEETTAAVHKELLRLEAKFSAFRSDSLVSRFQEGDRSAMLDTEFQEVYTAVIAAREETDSYFDPYFSGVYNPTGYVKGWIIEKVFKTFLRPLFAQPCIEAAALNGAGDMQVETAADSDFSWTIGIEDPDNLQRLLAQVQMRTGSLATSGRSKRGDHLLIKGREDLKQVTMIGKDLSWTDLWATAGFSAGQEKLDSLIRRKKLSGLYLAADGLHFFKEGEFHS